MTEQPQKPEQTPNQQPPVTPMKSAAPSKSDSQALQTALQTTLQKTLAWMTTTWIRLRPTTITGLRVIVAQSQQWLQQLETQEKTAAQKGESVAPIDWTPVVKLSDRFWTTVRPLWEKILTAVRPRLPQAFQPLSDRSLSGIFAGTLLLILWFFSALPSGQAAKVPDRSLDRNPPVENRSPYDRTYSRRSPSPQPLDRSSEKPVDSAFNRPFDSQPRPITDLTAPERVGDSASLSSPRKPVITTPQSQAIPAPIAPTATPAIAVMPSTPTESPESLSPEASRRLKLRQNLDLIANALVPQAIVGIRPNDRSKALTITLSEAWYRSPEETQTNLTNSLLVIAQGQGYSRLQLEDTEGAVIARNPVVGEGMIVLQRSRS